MDYMQTFLIKFLILEYLFKFFYKSYKRFVEINNYLKQVLLQQNLPDYILINKIVSYTT